jgi:hypothetical protein
MNDARKLYLRTYYRIDTIDHLIKNCKMGYRCWKYWHSPMNHAKSLAVVVAYSMYQECCEGHLNPNWKIAKPLTFWEFREILSVQMLSYNPQACKYPGDEKMRAVTRMSKSQRMSQAPKRPRGRPTLIQQAAGRLVTPVQFKDAKRCRVNSRLCGDLDKITKHTDAMISNMHHPKNCAWCGLPAYSKCTICEKHLHFYPKKGKAKGHGACFMHYHNDVSFGLGYDDTAELFGKPKTAWIEPTPEMLKENRKHIETNVRRSRS